MGCTQSSSTGLIQEGSTTTNLGQAVTDILNEKKGTYPLYGPNKIMARKQHGTSSSPVQSNLAYGCDFKTADRICNYNRHFAEHAGYFTSGKRRTEFLKAVEEAKKNKKKITFYDSNTGHPLFTAPVNRSWDAWLLESKNHGWPSFRDDEVNWEYVRCLRNGESVSVHGTHLGHNLPDQKGNRYCINLVSIAGNPVAIEQPMDSSNKTSSDAEIGV